MRRKLALSSAFLPVILLGVVACSHPQQSAPSTPPSGEECQGGLEGTLGCDDFSSTGATENGEPVEWVAGGSITLHAEYVNDTPTLVVGTPCNTLNIPIALHADVIVPGEATSTTKACDVTRAGEQTWTEGVFTTDMHWVRSEKTLTISAGTTTILFTAD
ncbi:hypothetical protein JVX92_12805 [Microbacterium hominis]|uniref:hypothetical protein n=1 Tax=Microbacterium hominis TaxID=162426 RepID=UPI0019630F32|nr:hypothetical protein [Microbacterium hominis]QRY40357.1 hypothetical protein JVX92_12805 [Microbacterium hominis]